MADIKTGRRNGKSFRQCDQLVQDIFTTGVAVVRDHQGGLHNRYLMEKLLNRLKIEHGMKPELDKENMIAYFPNTSWIAGGKGQENYEKALNQLRNS